MLVNFRCFCFCLLLRMSGMNSASGFSSIGSSTIGEAGLGTFTRLTLGYFLGLRANSAARSRLSCLRLLNMNCQMREYMVRVRPRPATHTVIMHTALAMSVAMVKLRYMYSGLNIMQRAQIQAKMISKVTTDHLVKGSAYGLPLVMTAVTMPEVTRSTKSYKAG